MLKTIVVSMTSADEIQADVVSVRDWSGFDSLASYLQARHGAQPIEKLDGADSRVWKFQIADTQISLHNNPDGNYFKAVGPVARCVLEGILAALEKCLGSDAAAGATRTPQTFVKQPWLRNGKDVLPPPLLARLALLYSEPHRRYHTQAHIEALLAHLSVYGYLANEPQLITAAIWFHDAIYDARRDDNEELSAQLAQTELERAGWESSRALRVADMVRATHHHQADEADTDQLLFLDFDLSILGASPATYAAYCAAIRFEFSWVSDADYSRGRSRVLKSFISREAIYRTPALRDAWENTARINIQRELDGLK